MGVIRVEKNSNYTVMANYHFKEKNMSWKAKGLMSVMLSLPENWDFTVKGLCALSSDGETATRSALKELEEFGYLKRERVYENGRICDINYILYEKPQLEKLKQENLIEENVIQENQSQLNTNIINNLNNKNTKEIKKKNSKKNKYLEDIEKILLEFDFSEKIQDKILDFFKNRPKKRLDAIRGQLQLLASQNSTDKEILDCIQDSITNDWNSICYRKNTFSKNKRPKDDIGLTREQEEEMWRRNDEHEREVKDAGGVANWIKKNNLQKF